MNRARAFEGAFHEAWKEMDPNEIAPITGRIHLILATACPFCTDMTHDEYRIHLDPLQCSPGLMGLSLDYPDRISLRYWRLFLIRKIFS